MLVSALFALSVKYSDINFIPIAFLPASAFWLLDGYYLRQERLHRKLYDSARKQQEAEIDFSMNTSEFFDDVDLWLSVCFSRTLLVFHGFIFLTITVGIFLI
ncbi:MAG: hypothetical protein AAF298_01890 [Cyanobacteria bacterium P01_A01_bin.40]